MPFGLTNVPADFQHFINDVLHPFLDAFCIVYLDDILIYSKTLEEYQAHIKKVLEALSKVGLHLKPEKCEFHITEVKCLELIISADGVKMDQKKVKAIVEWDSPKNLPDLCGLLGFSNFYRQFILGYSKVVSPMIKLMKKDVKFAWNMECEVAFQQLKNRLISAPIFMHFDAEREIIIETDASDYVSAGIISQYDDNSVLHLVADFSKKHLPAEYNYEIYDKELMAIIRCFEE